MVGSINAPTTGNNTFAAFQAAAMALGSNAPSVGAKFFVAKILAEQSVQSKLGLVLLVVCMVSLRPSHPVISVPVVPVVLAMLGNMGSALPLLFFQLYSLWLSWLRRMTLNFFAKRQHRSQTAQYVRRLLNDKRYVDDTGKDMPGT